jgi:aldose 1-epimerase
MSEITLDNEIMRVLIEPEKGAGVIALFVNRGGTWLPLMPDTREKGSALKSACFLMVPYSNRIENGSFTFGGKSYQLARGEEHAIHGDTRFRAWSIAAETDTSICCIFKSTAHAEVNWPWPFEARIEYTLSGNVFSSRLTLWNRGRSAMPAGFGWHPYFSRKITRDGEPVYLSMDTRGAYPDANDNRIPSGPAQPPAEEQDFSQKKPLQADLFLDACYQGYDGNGHIHWPQSGVKLTFECSSACNHLVIYNPPEPFFAVEPVTNANNGVNLYASGEENSGIVPLPPGESLEAEFNVRVDVK